MTYAVSYAATPARGSLLVFEHRPDLLTELRRLLVSVRVHRMPNRDREHLLFRAGDRERALLLARELAAIRHFSRCHRFSPPLPVNWGSDHSSERNERAIPLVMMSSRSEFRSEIVLTCRGRSC